MKELAKQVLPEPAVGALRRFRALAQSPLDVRRRRHALAAHYERGRPVDRYYIERFLDQYRRDVRGRVLEVADPNYTRAFGDDRVTRADVLHVVPGNPRATIVGNLETGENLGELDDAFDCFIATQLFHLMYDFRAAIRSAHRILAPGGVLLATLPCISQISRYDMERWGDFWRFTDASARRVFAEVFPPEHVTLATYGNVLSACAFLYQLGEDELTRTELDAVDPDYQVTIGVRAVKPPR